MLPHDLFELSHRQPSPFEVIVSFFSPQELIPLLGVSSLWERQIQKSEYIAETIFGLQHIVGSFVKGYDVSQELSEDETYFDLLSEFYREPFILLDLQTDSNYCEYRSCGGVTDICMYQPCRLLEKLIDMLPKKTYSSSQILTSIKLVP